ncbi:MAG: CotH kinase family protein, partial [Limisphaerales bacterium]
MLLSFQDNPLRYDGSGAQYVRDMFAMDSARAMGMVASHGTFVHLYLNGQYWGIYNPVERPDASFSATYRGGDKDSWDAINQGEVSSGNSAAWDRLFSLLNLDMSDPANYQQVQGNNPDGTRNPAYEDLVER